MPIDSRPTRLVPDDDPYLWLEDVEGEAARAWADRHSAATTAALGGPRLEADAAALLSILDRPDRIAHVSRRGGLLYNFWRDEAHPRGLWRRTTMESYRGGQPEWDVLLDVDALAAQENEDWIWQGATTRRPHHDRAIIRLSRGGSDAAVLRELDLATRTFVAGGFVVPEAKGYASWLDDDTLLLASAYGEGHATRAGYARTARLWPRGTAIADAKTLFEVPHEAMSCMVDLDRENDCLVFGEQIDFYRNRLWIGDRAGPATRIDVPDDARISWQCGWIAVRPRTAWTVAGKTYLPDMVLGLSRSRFLDGARDFRVLFTPERRKAQQGAFWSAGHLIISVLDELRPVFLRVAPEDDWRIEPVRGLPEVGTVSLWPLDVYPEEANGDLLVLTQTPVAPPTLSLLEPSRPAPALLRRSPAGFDPDAAVVTRHGAVAPDGERIPYVQIGPAGETGEAPVHMTAYGGFRVPVLPFYNSLTGKLWLERGGTCVVASLRGGGEFGTWWHDAGRREGKARSHDDFAAVADDLVRRGVPR